MNTQVVAVWAVGPDAPGTQVFTADEYADWAETNTVADAYPWPARFFGPTDDGRLVELTHTATADDFNADGYAVVTHTWDYPDPSTVRITGRAHRHGQA
ncbi:hypothetical protein O7623_10855 [Solwaraspora sp. WMMD791]|uniref:hypothetical protein n=1 Tax=Solwaraspora sp. WMMD791 TaxID=3016086 RepID=UPI00249A56CA|nr:hypothetical protein [Solwaraspora sp. WMMD791]WFE29646.1 hypothetical protein O7623_10855 [Solwaraspora sp. WMMD791]